MITKNAVVFGAGKIGRGFLTHLLVLSGYQITFVEKNSQTVSALRAAGKYTVYVMGSPERDITVSGYRVFELDDHAAVSEAIRNAAVIFVSIGGPNLPQVAPVLAAGLALRGKPINIILGENYFQPARLLRGLIREHTSEARRPWLDANVGIVETMILRSSIEPSGDLAHSEPLSLKVQNWWQLPADKEAFVGAVPTIVGLEPKENFQSGLIRKLFTYNSINAVIAYSGHLKGYKMLSEAANDEEILALARESYSEGNDGLCKAYGFDPEEQRDFAEAAITKYRNREIVDPIERNARDPIRKVARYDRLVGPTCLAVEGGAKPEALCHGIAAAYLYNEPADPSSVRLQEIIRQSGIRAAIQQVSNIEQTYLLDTISRWYEQLSQ